MMTTYCLKCKRVIVNVNLLRNLWVRLLMDIRRVECNLHRQFWYSLLYRSTHMRRNNHNDWGSKEGRYRYHKNLDTRRLHNEALRFPYISLKKGRVSVKIPSSVSTLLHSYHLQISQERSPFPSSYNQAYRRNLAKYLNWKMCIEMESYIGKKN